jgi:hypothetical protein
MSGLDDLLAEFEDNKGVMPQVNPPEASAVLAAKTAPEVAGEPEPPEAEEAPPAPTEKPAEVKAAEAAKARKPRAGAKNAGGQPGLVAAAPPDGWNNTPAPAGCTLHSAILSVKALLPPGVTVEITGG